MTALDLDLRLVPTRALTIAGRIGSAMSAKSTGVERRIWKGLTTAIDDEWTRRQATARMAVLPAFLDIDDSPPDAVMAAIDYVMVALHRLSDDADDHGVRRVWEAASAALVTQQDRRRSALDELERTYGAPVVSREGPA